MELVYREGRLVTLTRWLESIDPRSLSSDPSLLIMRGRLYRQEGDFDRALAIYDQARELYSIQGDRKGELAVQIHEALVHRYRGAMEQARTWPKRRSVVRMHGLDPAISAQAHRIIGEYHHLVGALEHAEGEFATLVEPVRANRRSLP